MAQVGWGCDCFLIFKFQAKEGNRLANTFIVNRAFQSIFVLVIVATFRA